MWHPQDGWRAPETQMNTVKWCFTFYFLHFPNIHQSRAASPAASKPPKEWDSRNSPTWDSFFHHVSPNLPSQLLLCIIFYLNVSLGTYGQLIQFSYVVCIFLQITLLMKARVPILFIARVQPLILILCLIYSHRFQDSTKNSKKGIEKCKTWVGASIIINDHWILLNTRSLTISVWPLPFTVLANFISQFHRWTPVTASIFPVSSQT